MEQAACSERGVSRFPFGMLFQSQCIHLQAGFGGYLAQIFSVFWRQYRIFAISRALSLDFESVFIAERLERRALPRRNRVPEFDRMGDQSQPLDRSAGAANADRAVVEDPAEDRLIDDDQFDLVDVHLVRMAVDEALRINDAMVRHRDFDGEGVPPGASQDDKAQKIAKMTDTTKRGH